MAKRLFFEVVDLFLEQSSACHFLSLYFKADNICCIASDNTVEWDGEATGWRNNSVPGWTYCDGAGMLEFPEDISDMDIMDC